MSSNNSWVTSGSQCCEAKVEEVQLPPDPQAFGGLHFIFLAVRHFGKFLAQQTTCAMSRRLSVQRSEQFSFLCTSWQVPSPWPHARIPATGELAASQQRRSLVTKPWSLLVQRLNPLSTPGLWPNTLERKMQELAFCFPRANGVSCATASCSPSMNLSCCCYCRGTPLFQIEHKTAAHSDQAQ